MIPSSSNSRGLFDPEGFEFRLDPNGVSEFIMVSYNLGCYFVFTSHGKAFSPELCGSVLDILGKVKRV